MSEPHSDAMPRVGVGALIQNERGEVLLTLRKRAPEAGCWSITGGKVEFMETLHETAIREAKEESGLDVEIVRLLCVTDHLVRDEGQHWVAPAYLARITGGVLSNPEPEKTETVAFFALDQLPQRLTITAQNAISALQTGQRL